MSGTAEYHTPGEPRDIPPMLLPNLSSDDLSYKATEFTILSKRLLEGEYGEVVPRLRGMFVPPLGENIVNYLTSKQDTGEGSNVANLIGDAVADGFIAGCPQVSRLAPTNPRIYHYVAASGIILEASIYAALTQHHPTIVEDIGDPQKQETVLQFISHVAKKMAEETELSDGSSSLTQTNQAENILRAALELGQDPEKVLQRFS